MRNKIIILLCVVAIILGLVSVNNEKQLKKTSAEHHAKIEKRKQTKKQKESHEQTNEEKLKKQLLAVNIPDDIQIDLAQQQYSSEPLIELVTVSWILQGCKRMNHMDFQNLNVSETSEGFFLNYQENCKKINNDYSAVSHLGNGNESEMALMKIALNSRYAELIQKGMTLRFMSDEQKKHYINEAITTVLNSKNAAIISSLDTIIRTADTQDYLNKLSEILGTINSSYTKLIITQASTLLSCQYNNGISCSPTSNYMLRLCLVDELACGQDVAAWFQSSLTPAHNRDIAKLVDFFESQLQ